ncbi:MAG TPA: twin-arginine translocase TatA/TatE family subunit [Thermoanaerobaculia bacterium]|jgi:TatA/E family protein of Tat protein translocase|nr:twin-arginine translocase TatA/TatE family subunit [Thermoanaerobaculia bacterium]
MFGPLGFPELVFILVLALLIFGPKRLPEIGRTIGRGMAEFRKASTDLKRTINTELALDEPVAPPVRPWMEPAAPPIAPANTAARVPPATWLPRSEPESREPDDTPDLPLSAAEAQAQSSEAPSPEPLEPS